MIGPQRNEMENKTSSMDARWTECRLSDRASSGTDGSRLTFTDDEQGTT